MLTPASPAAHRSRETAPDIGALPDGAFLTRKQVAHVTSYDWSTFKRWARKGRGPTVTMIEGRPRYRVGDVRAWLASQSRRVA